jgi:hypothetical protein
MLAMLLQATLCLRAFLGVFSVTDFMINITTIGCGLHFPALPAAQAG